MMTGGGMVVMSACAFTKCRLTHKHGVIFSTFSASVYNHQIKSIKHIDNIIIIIYLKITFETENFENYSY